MGRGVQAFGWVVTILATAACAAPVPGLAVRPPGAEQPLPAAVDVGALMLDLPRMRGITGGGDDLNIIPSLDADYPVDIDPLADELPPPCRFLFAETAVFGPDLVDFHKITYQQPPVGGLISQGAAAYTDPPAAQHAYDALAESMNACAQTSFGQSYVGIVTVDGGVLTMRPGGACGRDYRLKSTVLAEVTYCAYPESVPGIVMTNLLAKVPE